jgi:CobN/Magnesium Chelatase
LCSVSEPPKCCRDSFQNVVELLDDMFQRAAAADEPLVMNFIKSHAQSLQESGQDAPASAARLFSNPAGDYGSMVNERVGASNWNTRKVRSCTEHPCFVLQFLPLLALTSSFQGFGSMP